MTGWAGGLSPAYLSDLKRNLDESLCISRPEPKFLEWAKTCMTAIQKLNPCSIRPTPSWDFGITDTMFGGTADGLNKPT